MSGWKSVSSDPPPYHKTVLTIHKDDLYPQAASRGCGLGTKDYWIRQLEGPEDTDDRRPGQWGELYRPPTHWMELPDWPEDGE